MRKIVKWYDFLLFPKLNAEKLKSPKQELRI